MWQTVGSEGIAVQDRKWGTGESDSLLRHIIRPLGLKLRVEGRNSKVNLLLKKKEDDLIWLKATNIYLEALCASTVDNILKVIREYFLLKYLLMREIK